MLTAGRARELFDYDPETGVLVWKKPPIRQNSRVGSPAGSKRQRGREVGADGRKYLVHRIVWLWVYGTWPRGSIDHINGDAMDNRVSNLRDVSHQVNMQNQRGLSKNNVTGFKGVTMSRGKFRAQISVGGRQRNLGRYSTPEEAHAVYLKAKRELHEGCTI